MLVYTWKKVLLLKLSAFGSEISWQLTSTSLFNKFACLKHFEKTLYIGREFNPFPANVSILYSLNTFGFLVFLGDIKWEHWPEMGQFLYHRYIKTVVNKQSWLNITLILPDLYLQTLSIKLATSWSRRTTSGFTSVRNVQYATSMMTKRLSLSIKWT